MIVNLPWNVSEDSTSLTSINLPHYPYLVSTKEEPYVMSREEIIMRLEAALYDKDWDAVELILEDLRVVEEDIDQWSETWDD